MQVTVSKIDQVLYAGEARSLHVPGTEGEMTILPHHSALVSALRAGEVRVESADGTLTFSIDKGFLEVGGNSATVLV